MSKVITAELIQKIKYGIFYESNFYVKDDLNAYLYQMKEEDNIDAFCDETTMLWLASYADNRILVKTLLEFGADVNACRGKDGITPLHGACSEENIEVVKILLKYGADISIKNYWNEKACDVTKNSEILKLLK